MRIAIVGETYLPGNNGQAIFTIHLAEGLARSGNEVHMIYPASGYRYSHTLVNGVHVHRVRSMPFDWIHPDIAYTLFPGWQCQSIFRRYPPDIVHIQDHYFTARGAALVARRNHLPLIGSNHFLPENVLPYINILPLPRGWKISILWSLMLWTYNTLELITTPTETAASILRKQNVHVPVVPVSCGVDANRFTPNPDLDRAAACAQFGLDPNKRLLLYVGRQDREKRIDLLLRGLNLLVKGGCRDWQLAIAGRGAHSGDLKSLAHTLGLDDCVKFLGYIPNEKLPLLYQTGHIFGMPSPEELQSIATLEAMSSGRPILAANARALPELVAHQVNGYLFEPGKAESVAQGLTYLAAHADEWQQMGQASRARAVAHSLDSTIQRYEEIYTLVCEAHHAAAGRPVQIKLKALKSE